MTDSGLAAIEDQLALLNREWAADGWAIWVQYGTWAATGDITWMARNRALMPEAAQFLAAATAGQLNTAIETTAAAIAAAVP